VAEALKRALGVTADLKVGNPGEFTVWVDSQKVAEKEGDEFPSETQVVTAVRGVLPKEVR
jgi:hypothetical protein